MEKKKRLLREGKLRKKCDEQALFTCNECGEKLSKSAWAESGGDCPVCMEGRPDGPASCATCKAPLKGLEYDTQDGLTTSTRSCHSVAVFEKTGKVAFDPSGESDGHEIPETKPKKEPTPKPQPKPRPAPEPPAPTHQPLYIDIVLVCIGASVCLLFARLGLPADWLGDPSLAYAIGTAMLSGILSLKLCRTRFKRRSAKPGRVTSCLILAALVATTTFYSLQQLTGLSPTEVSLYTSSVCYAIYSISRLGFNRLSALLTLVSALTAGYFFANSDLFSPPGISSTSETPKAAADPTDKAYVTPRPIASPPILSSSEPKGTPASLAQQVTNPTVKSDPPTHTEKSFVQIAGKEFVMIDGVAHPLDIAYKIRIDPEFYPLIEPQRDIFRGYEKALEQMLKAPTDAKLADNYRSFLAWKKNYQKIENTRSALVDEKFKSLSRGAGAKEPLDYKVIDHVLKSGPAFRAKIDALIGKYRRWQRQDPKTIEPVFEANFPWDELKADFQKELVRVRSNLGRFPRNL